MTNDDPEAVRRGYWLRLAREAADVTLSDAAQTAGLSAKSGSTVGLWEAGKRPIKVHQMKRLAIRYGVPVSWFTNPKMTDLDRLRARVDAATELGLADPLEGEEPDPQAGDEPDGPRRTRSS